MTNFLLSLRVTINPLNSRVFCNEKGILLYFRFFLSLEETAMWRDWGETRVDHEKTLGKTRGQFFYIRQSTNACWTSTTSTLLRIIHNILELTPGGGQVI